MLMLKEFTFKNCYSFKDEVTLSMVANHNMKDNINFVTLHGDGDNAIYLNPVAAIYGTNAGGKTNIYKALLDAVDNISKREVYNIPFMYPEKKDCTFSHKLVVVHDDIEYEYEYTASYKPYIRSEESEVLKESLKIHALKANDGKKTVFLREREKIIDSMYNNNDDRYKFISEIASSKSVLVMRHGGEFGWEHFRPIYQWCRNVVIETDEDRYEFLKKYAATLFLDNDKLSKFSDFITHIDPSISKVDILKSSQQTERKRFFIFHQFLNEDGEVAEAMFRTQTESNGMVKLMELYPKIKEALDEGRPFVCDELDKFLHPLIFMKILEWFNDTGENGRNKKGAQLIFTAHNTIVVDRENLRRDEIYFVQKNKYGESIAKRLSEITDEKGNKIRLDARYNALYINGNFGAIPEEFLNVII